MKHSELKRQLSAHFQLPQAGSLPPELLERARLESQALARRRRLSFPQFLARQIPFLGWKIWAVQALCLVALWLLPPRLFGDHFWMWPQGVVQLLLCLSVLVAMAAPPLLYRSVRHRMQEVEAAARFSCLHLLLARLLILGIGDVSFFSGLVLLTASQSTLPPWSAALALGLPFLVFSSGSLFLLSHGSPRQFLLGSTLLGGVLLGVNLNLGRHLPWMLSPEKWPFHLALAAGLLLICGTQLPRLFCTSAYAPKQVLAE